MKQLQLTKETDMVLLLHPDTARLIAKSGNTINSFAKKHGFNPSSLRNWIRSKNFIPASKLFELADVLGVDAESISNLSQIKRILKGENT